MNYAKAIVVTGALLAESACASKFSSHTDLDKYTFEDFARQSGNKYDAGELNMREKIFYSNLQKIREHNSKGLSWNMGINKFSDRTDEELEKHFGGNKYALRTSKALETSLLKSGSVSELPESVDWRFHNPNVVSAVKDQGHCGSCWAFAATATIESHVALNTGLLNELSPQELVSCMPNDNNCGGTGGCQGATAELAFDYLASSGLSELWSYGYLPDTYASGVNNKCFSDSVQPVATGSGFNLLKRNDYDEIMNALATVGPLAVNVDASTWHTYDSGVFTGCAQEDVDINHVVVLVGYGSTHQGQDYWLVRNSWSPSWGEGGYIRLERSPTYCGMDYHNSDGVGCDTDPQNVTVCGMCGIMYDVSYPTEASTA